MIRSFLAGLAVFAAALSPVAGALAAPDQTVWPGSQKLKINKKKVVEACAAAGADQQTVALVLAVGMQETTEFDACDRDCSKDAVAHCRNYSAFNFNGDMLNRLYKAECQWDTLNDQSNLHHAVEVILLAMKTWGVDRFLCFHRGGRTAFEDGCSYGVKEYKEAIYRAAKYMMEHPNTMTDETRVASEVSHV